MYNSQEKLDSAIKELQKPLHIDCSDVNCGSIYCENERLKDIIKQIDELTGFNYDTMPESGKKESHKLICEIINKYYLSKNNVHK